MQQFFIDNCENLWNVTEESFFVGINIIGFCWSPLPMNLC